MVGFGDPDAMQWTLTASPIIVVKFFGSSNHFGAAEIKKKYRHFYTYQLVIYLNYALITIYNNHFGMRYTLVINILK